MGKLINRIPGLRLLISSLPGSALRTHVLKALPGKLDIKRHSPSILYVSGQKECVESNGSFDTKSLDIVVIDSFDLLFYRIGELNSFLNFKF